jgi:hypothetical protein
MKELVPVIQTVLWVGLIGVVLYRYHSLIEALITSLKTRIDSGGTVKVGPIELAALTKPLNPEQQAKKLDEEVAQILKADQAERLGEIEVPTTEESVRSLYLRAEDLALREIQYEYQAPVGRQIQIGNNLEFDGAFARDGTLYVIEIKYSGYRPVPRAVIEQTIARLLSRIGKRRWKNVRVIFAVVYGDSSVDLAKERQRIAEAISEYGDKVDIRCYHLDNLAKKFGITS